MRKKLYITLKWSEVLSDEKFGFLAVHTENLKSKFSKSLLFRRLETVPNQTIPKHEKDWKDETDGERCRSWARCKLFTARQVAQENGIGIRSIWKTV